nr:EOG090X058A [Artemia franciscana]
MQKSSELTENIPLAVGQCTHCQEFLGPTKVKCKVCTDFSLCVLCFSTGAEIGQHKSHHGYHFEDKSEFSVFPSGEDEKSFWTAKEEILLLDAIELYGFGNFADVSKYIETRSADEVREHYVQRYVCGTIGRLTWLSVNRAGAEPGFITKDHTGPDFGPLSPSFTARVAPLQIQQDESLQLGYMPNRDDFETEYDNDAELLVSHLDLNATTDEDIDMALKLAQVDMYQRRLRERAQRKRLVRDYQLAQEFFIPIKKGGVDVAKKITDHRKKLIKADRDLFDKFRPFVRFHTFNEHEQFLKNLSRARQLRTRIRELLKYRKNGLTRSEECVEYERQRYKREKKKEDRKRAVMSQMLPPQSMEVEMKPTQSQWLHDRQPDKNLDFKYGIQLGMVMTTFSCASKDCGYKWGPTTANFSTAQPLYILSSV